jgi:cytoskeletal protein CcmA (bactofilin family)
MKKIVRVASLILLVMLVFLPFQSVAAKGSSFDGKVIFGQSFTLQKGETLKGDLLVFGGTATLEEGAIVNGDVVLFGGTLDVKGEVRGDVVVTGGSVTVASTAHVYGDLTTVGASLARADGAQVDGQISNTATSWVSTGETGKLPATPTTPSVPSIPGFSLNFDPFWSMMRAFGQALAMAMLAMLVMLFLSPHADRVAHAVIAQPLMAGGIGLLTIIVVPVALVLLTITIILIPVVAVCIVVLVVALVFGWIAIGYEIGQRFTEAIHRHWHPALSAGLGVFVLTLVARALTGIPVLNCIGWLVPFLLGLAGLGAIIMTRFGTLTVLATARVAPAPFTPTPVTPASSVQVAPTAAAPVEQKPQDQKEE